MTRVDMLVFSRVIIRAIMAVIRAVMTVICAIMTIGAVMVATFVMERRCRSRAVASVVVTVLFLLRRARAVIPGFPVVAVARFLASRVPGL